MEVVVSVTTEADLLDELGCELPDHVLGIQLRLGPNSWYAGPGRLRGLLGPAVGFGRNFLRLLHRLRHYGDGLLLSLSLGLRQQALDPLCRLPFSGRLDLSGLLFGGRPYLSGLPLGGRPCLGGFLLGGRPYPGGLLLRRMT